MRSSAGGVHKGTPRKSSRPVTVRRHLSAEDIAAMAANDREAIALSGKPIIAVMPYESGTGAVSQGTLRMCNNNRR